MLFYYFQIKNLIFIMSSHETYELTEQMVIDNQLFIDLQVNFQELGKEIRTTNNLIREKFDTQFG